ncbi:MULTISPECIES: sensor domain-containing diguanylate cyclase [Gammaproteobacteria]|uniref:sensor domain-containing diguanylate cyclase n=1 Tax=Gammaproteobacteria TaxID=1236 RepID=UPI000DD0AE9D|nr:MULTISPECIES: sensor domain-containing diguanylate cyclase [Gammaproteobacteria]RTE85581.1 sensor domain-containing diguanylate cyclase [Aliidiomarina sp. B3213]TCZ89551.1 sensor domain-containing diguanylate cyclase [Lysobacter sp. N42]
MESKHFPIPNSVLVEYFNQLTDHLFIAKPCEDGDFELVSGNATMLRFFGMEPEQVIGRTLRQVLGEGAAAERIIATYQQVLESGRHLVYEEDSGGTDFDYEVFETSLFRFEDPETGQYRIGGISRNISLRKSIEESLELSKRKLESKVRELEVVHKQLAEESMRDPLTSLLNRRHLDEFLHHEIARSQRQKVPLSIMMVDLDNFKQLNDNYGHQVGDQVLRDFGRFLRSNRRGSDIIFRFGGDEFLFMLPGLNSTQAEQLAHQLHQDLQKQTFDIDNDTTKLQISIGIASYAEHETGAYELIEQADSALYQAKKLGKNTTVTAEQKQKSP